MKRTTVSLALATMALVVVSAAGASGLRQQSSSAHRGMTPNIVQDASSNPQLSTLVSLVKKAGLVSALSNPSAHLTVFAPTNDAFAALKKADPMTFAAVLASPALLKKILTYHVLPQAVDAAAATTVAAKHGTVASLEGEKITLSLKAGKLYLNGTAEVTKANVQASNGVIHIINAVIVPPSVKVTG